MLAAIDNQEHKKFFTEWFVLDENSVPATHVLQPISSVYRDFNSKNSNARKTAEANWKKAFDKLQNILHFC